METGNFPVQTDNRDEDSGNVALGSGEIQPGKLTPLKRSQMLSLPSLHSPSPKFKVYLLIPLSEVCAENSYLDFTGSSWHLTKNWRKAFHSSPVVQ